MANFFEALFKFLSEFTWPKLRAVFIVIMLLLGLFSLYEWYTASFRFSRLQKAADLLMRLEELHQKSTNGSPELDRARTILTAQSLKAIEEKPLSLQFVPSNLRVSTKVLWRFLAGAAVWLALGLVQLARREPIKERLSMLFGLTIIGGGSGLVGLIVPPIWWPWFHLFLFPLVLLILIGSLTAIVTAFRTAKKKAIAVNCSNNLTQVALAAQTWALDHNGLLPASISLAQTELANENLTRCPADKTRKYQLLAANSAVTGPDLLYASCPIHKHTVRLDGTVEPDIRDAGPKKDRHNDSAA